MLRPLSLALALALPVAAQNTYQPTNLTREHHCALLGVQLIDGKLYAIFAQAITGGSARVDAWFYLENRPPRIDVELWPVGLLAIDSRPCARDGKSILTWGTNTSGWAGAGSWLAMPTSGYLWWAGRFPYPLRGGGEWGPEVAYYYLDYWALGKRSTSCATGNGPEYLAIMFEVKPR